MFKLGNIASMMGGLQKLPQAITEMNDRLRDERFEVSAGDGAVVAEFNGIGEMQSITFDSSSHGNETLQQWVLEACNEGQAKAKQMYGEAMKDLANELNLHNMPGMDGALASLTGGQ